MVFLASLMTWRHSQALKDMSSETVRHQKMTASCVLLSPKPQKLVDFKSLPFPRVVSVLDGVLATWSAFGNSTLSISYL